MALPPDTNDSLLQKMSAEVSPEVSPLLRFLLDHARTIAIVIGLILAATAGFGIYSWYNNKQLDKARIELGRIEISPSAADRIKELEAFATRAPASMSTAVNLALAKSSLEIKDYDRAIKAWDAIARDPQGSFYLVAVLGKAQALVMQDKGADALAVLEKIAPTVKDGAKALVDKAIADVAEKMGNFDRAIAASEALAANNAIISEAEYWRQKAAALRQQQAAKPAQ